MRILLHIGPHKTGTTTVQHYLAAVIGSRVPPQSGDWYPLGGGRSHNTQFIALLGGDPSSVRDLLATARDSGVDRLFLSAEAACMAYPDRLERIAGALADEQVTLVTTLSSPVRRATSMWQEHVKHKYHQLLEQAPEGVLDHPSFRPDLVPAFVRALAPEQTEIFVPAPSGPRPGLLTLWSDAFGLPVPDDAQAMPQNAGLGYIETELWRYLNLLLKHHARDMMAGDGYAALRRVLWQTFTSPEWREACPQLRIPIPNALREAVADLAQETHAELVALSSSHPVTVHGDLDALLDRPDIPRLDPGDMQDIYERFFGGLPEVSGPGRPDRR